MMVLPFALITLGLGAIFLGNRQSALSLRGLALLVSLWLFHLHASDALNLTF